ncbi:MAG: GFA family protein [Woeseiaceae bacterium]
MPDRHGHCLCGAVKITATNTDNTIGACHCKMCRRWGGGPFMEIECGTNVSFEGDDNIAVYDSSDWAQRGFCKRCGTHLFYRFNANAHHGVPIGLFEDDDTLVFAHQVFVDEKPSYYEFSNETKDLTGPELIAKYQQL